jgi:hypothetical protein
MRTTFDNKKYDKIFFLVTGKKKYQKGLILTKATP